MLIGLGLSLIVSASYDIWLVYGIASLRVSLWGLSPSVEEHIFSGKWRTSEEAFEFNTELSKGASLDDWG